ncbi:hypothetical protein BDZ91DRAFT_738320 [Kalaharituber pfeilii]|nr:hypothetical protein BDZ91DRAFT_738320 [Kalaharituber pfeilii]
MALSNSVLFAAFSLLFALNVFANTLDNCLRSCKFNKFADLIQQYPNEIFNKTGVIVFAPTNGVVKEFLSDPTIVLTGNSQNWRRANGPGVTVYNQGSVHTGAPPIVRPRGSVFHTSLVAEPKTARVWKRTKENPLGFFAFTPTFETAIERAGLNYLEEIFVRLPEALKAIACEKTVTFFAPTEEAFAKSGLDTMNSDDAELQAFLDDHTLVSDFIGYTPEFEHGKKYKMKSGKYIVATVKGSKVFLDGALIVQQDLITSNGVIQIIDKVLKL